LHCSWGEFKNIPTGMTTAINKSVFQCMTANSPLGHEENSRDPDSFPHGSLLHIYQWTNILSAYTIKALTILVG